MQRRQNERGVLVSKLCFGFVTSTTGEDVFFLFTDISHANWPNLTVGQMVKFTVYSGAKRIQAIDIELV